MSCPCYLITEAEVYRLTSSSPNSEAAALTMAMDAAHRGYIRPLIGATCFDELCTAIADDTVTAEQQALLDQMQRLCAYAVMREYLLFDPRNIVAPAGFGSVSGEGPYTYAQAETDARNRRVAYMEQNRDAEAVIVREYLAANAVDFPCYTVPTTGCVTPAAFT